MEDSSKIKESSNKIASNQNSTLNELNNKNGIKNYMKI